MKKSLWVACSIVFLSASLGAAMAQSQDAACQAAWAAYNQQVAIHNANCSNVEAGTPQAEACQAEQERLMASRPNC